jgi:hypothetical protein
VRLVWLTPAKLLVRFPLRDDIKIPPPEELPDRLRMALNLLAGFLIGGGTAAYSKPGSGPHEGNGALVVRQDALGLTERGL